MTSTEESWILRLAVALAAATPGAAVSALFAPAGVLRDSLVFSWDVRALEGAAAISEYVARGVEARGCVREVRLESVDGGRLFFAFRTPLGRGRGGAQLDAHGRAEWATFMLDVLDGNDEAVPVDSAAYRRASETAPYVVVVGAGQSGLNVAARLRRLGVPTLMLERLPRVGDVWRARYAGLALNTPNAHHALLYEPYPTDWPEYTPKDMLADWMEQYAAAQDLALWTSASLAPLPPYDAASRTWTLNVTRGDGATATLRPAHVVLATSTLGAPHVPSLPSAHLFPGPVLHSSAFRTPAPFAEKAVLIVGAGNTAADLATLLASVARSVVLLQRSPTCMIFPRAARGYWAAQNPPGMPPEEADFRAACVPARVRMRAVRAWAEQKGEDADIGDDDDRARRDALRTAGFRTWTGPDGGGAVNEIDERFAGYVTDLGFSGALSEGRISVLAGAPARFSADGVILENGSTVPCDAVIFATGYTDARDVWAGLLGDTGPAWARDDEGELAGAYRPRAHPGAWAAPGDFAQSRWGSKQLGLLLLASQLEYV